MLSMKLAVVPCHRRPVMVPEGSQILDVILDDGIPSLVVQSPTTTKMKLIKINFIEKGEPMKGQYLGTLVLSGYPTAITVS